MVAFGLHEPLQCHGQPGYLHVEAHVIEMKSDVDGAQTVSCPLRVIRDKRVYVLEERWLKPGLKSRITSGIFYFMTLIF